MPTQTVLDGFISAPSMPTLDRDRVTVSPVSHLTAARMVKEFHYARRVPSIVFAVGLYVDQVLAGVCTYGIPASPEVRLACGAEFRWRTIELNRLFIHEWAGRNSESYLLGQSFRWLRERHPEYCVLVSYADTAQGHTGAIYRATNWLYTGTSDQERKTPRFDIVMPGDSRHSRQITRNGGSQAAYAAGGVRVPRSTKHRYVMFIGDRRTRRAAKQALRWPVVTYGREVQR